MIETIYEYYNVNDTSSLTVYGTNFFIGQTFTVGTVGENISHVLKTCKLKLSKLVSDETGQLDIEIYATDINGLPVGESLSIGNVQYTEIPFNSDGTWMDISMTDYTLQPNTQYAIILKYLEGISFPSKKAYWRRDITIYSYIGGNTIYTTNGGSSWLKLDYQDLMFEIWGTIPSNETSIDVILKSSTNQVIELKSETNKNHNLKSETNKNHNIKCSTNQVIKLKSETNKEIILK